MESIDETKAIIRHDDAASESDDSMAQGSQSVMDIAFRAFMNRVHEITGGVRYTFDKTSKFLQLQAPGAEFIYEYQEFSRDFVLVASVSKSKLKDLGKQKKAVHNGTDQEILEIDEERTGYAELYEKESGKARTYSNAERKLSVYLEQARNGKEAAEKEMKTLVTNMEELDEVKQIRIMKCTIADTITKQPLDKRRWSKDFPKEAVAKELGTDCTGLNTKEVQGKFHALYNLGFTTNDACPPVFAAWKRVDEDRDQLIARLHSMLGDQHGGGLPESPTTRKRRRSQEVPSREAIEEMEAALQDARAKRRRFLQDSDRL